MPPQDWTIQIGRTPTKQSSARICKTSDSTAIKAGKAKKSTAIPTYIQRITSSLENL